MSPNHHPRRVKGGTGPGSCWPNRASTSVTVEDVYTPGYPLRLRLTCPKCGAEYLTKNTARLRLFLDAVAHGQSKITLT